MDRKELKTAARQIVRASRPSAIWVTLMAAAALLILQGLSLTLSGDLEAYRAMYESVLAGSPTYVPAAGANGPIGWLLTLALDLMGMVMSAGYMLYILRLSRGQNPSFGDVFDAFGIFFRAVWITILRSVLISLWAFAYALPAALLSSVMDPVIASMVCLPFLIPMGIAAYNYRLAVLILLDERRYSCIQCLALSRMAMRGRKWELFKLDLSFIGWILLSLIPFVYLWVEPYMSVTLAKWYDGVMPAFQKQMEQEWQARQSGSRPPYEGRYHVPGEPWQGDEDREETDEDDTDDDNPGGDDAP